MRRSLSQEQLASWCRRWLGAEPSRVLFEAGYLSAVVGLELANGRTVVVKAREPADRIAACVQVQRHLWAAGFPCPEPLAGPAPLGALLATAEVYLPGGTLLAPGPDTPRLYAEALAASVALAPPLTTLPTLAPPPAWMWWDHNQPGIWPIPDDPLVSLNVRTGPEWLDEVGRRVRQRLAQCEQPAVAGHADWYSENLRWHGQQLHTVHDWDSVAARPEAAIAGAAAACFSAGIMSYTEPTIAETASFLAAYERARGRPWNADERQVCWAAGVWLHAYHAKKALIDRNDHILLDRLAGEASARLQLAGA